MTQSHLKPYDGLLVVSLEQAVAAPPVRHSFEPDHVRYGRVPALGEHSASIRKEFAPQKRRVDA